MSQCTNVEYIVQVLLKIDLYYKNNHNFGFEDNIAKLDIFIYEFKEN